MHVDHLFSSALGMYPGGVIIEDSSELTDSGGAGESGVDNGGGVVTRIDWEGDFKDSFCSNASTAESSLKREDWSEMSSAPPNAE